jgi:membrane protease YdiL (CAAX protease family)
MNDQPLLLLLMIAAAVYVAKLWRDDCHAAMAGRTNPRALPGATHAPLRAILIAVAGALVLLALETWGEIRLGIAGEQSRMTLLFGAYTLAAAVIEEIIFRGYLVITHRGAAVRWAGIVGASLLFAALHPFLWKWNQGLVWTPGLKGWFSTGLVFLGSLWFYAVRFYRWNPAHSLLPCIAAHAAKNLGVIGIKAAQGFLVGWW